MQITKSIPGARQKILLAAIDCHMMPIQDEINALNDEYQQAMIVVTDVQNRIRAKRPELVPLAEMKAGVASINSRNKYFPEFLGRFDDKAKTDLFLDWVEKELS